MTVPNSEGTNVPFEDYRAKNVLGEIFLFPYEGDKQSAPRSRGKRAHTDVLSPRTDVNGPNSHGPISTLSLILTLGTRWSFLRGRNDLAPVSHT